VVDVPPVVLDRGSGTPLSVQLADALRAATVGGTLRPGDRLPSTRELAVALRVSRTVTAAAYDQLLAEGWADGRRGVGTFVVGAQTAAPARSPARPTAPRVAAAPIELRAGAPCLEVLDRSAWRPGGGRGAPRGTPLPTPARSRPPTRASSAP